MILEVKEYIEISCEYCGKYFYRSNFEINHNINRDNKNFCSASCASKWGLNGRGLLVKNVTCSECGKSYKPSYQQRKIYHKYHCSEECFNVSRKLKNIECLQCGNEFRPYSATRKFCSTPCSNKYRTMRPESMKCQQCGKKFEPASKKAQFCSQHCSGVFIMAHIKRSGSKISRLELYIKEILQSTYSFPIYFNKIEEILMELDIYIPHLKLAFEINGPSHYRPIHGEAPLKRTIKNDRKKRRLCTAKGISLHVICTNNQRNYSEETSAKYLKKVKEFIDKEIRHFEKTGKDI